MNQSKRQKTRVNKQKTEEIEEEQSKQRKAEQKCAMGRRRSYEPALNLGYNCYAYVSRFSMKLNPIDTNL